VDELSGGVAHGKRGDEERFMHVEGLVIEPMDAGEDEEGSRKIGCGPGEEDATLISQKPQGGGNDDEKAEPSDLAGGSAEGVGRDGEAEPADGGA